MRGLKRDIEQGSPQWRAWIETTQTRAAGASAVRGLNRFGLRARRAHVLVARAERRSRGLKPPTLSPLLSPLARGLKLPDEAARMAPIKARTRSETSPATTGSRPRALKPQFYSAHAGLRAWIKADISTSRSARLERGLKHRRRLEHQHGRGWIETSRCHCASSGMTVACVDQNYIDPSCATHAVRPSSLDRLPYRPPAWPDASMPCPAALR